MRDSSANNKRVLAIDPYTKGFGFAVLEGPERLIDYGVKKVKGDKNCACLKKFAGLIERYQPEVIVLENPTGKGSRRGQRVKKLLKEILVLAASKRIKAQSFSWSQTI
jgi:RNase H-fold protein (predicted Holliday junction resolvase)